MQEAVASRDHAHRLCSTTDAERHRQLDELQQLIERFIEEHDRLRKELKNVTAERDRLKDENERLKRG